MKTACILLLALGSAASVRAEALPKNDLKFEDRAKWRPLLKWPDDCEKGFAVGDQSQAGLHFYALTGNTYLVEVSCAPGAYQGSQTYVRWDETTSPGQAELLKFPAYLPVGEKGTTIRKQSVTELWGMPTFQEKDKRLVMLSRFRGPGDCGWMGVYSFPDGRPRLQLFRLKTACDGRLAGQPDKWRLYGSGK